VSAAVIGSVSELHRYPVKSMLGEQLTRAIVTPTGVAGDRAYALVDDETGKVISVKRPKRWGRMFELVATTDGEAVRVSFPDGTALAIDDAELPKRLSDFFGRAVSVTTAPPGTGYDEAWVGELKDGASPYPGIDSATLDGEEFIDGGAFMRNNGNFFDFGTIHLVTTATTTQLAAQAPGSRFDPHRFRANIVVNTPAAGFVENEWPGRALTIGEVRLKVTIPVPRCVMTTLRQGDLPADKRVLQTISKHNGLDLLSTGTSYPCVGVYADVVAKGEISVGDEVAID
jgi:uncharacterized protein YcbX